MKSRLLFKSLLLLVLVGTLVLRQNDLSSARLTSPPENSNDSRTVASRLHLRAAPVELPGLLDSRNHAAVAPTLDSDDQDLAMEHFVNSIPLPQIQAALNSILDDGTSEAGQIRSLLVRRWAENAPEAAAEYAAQLGDATMRLSAVEQISIAWAEQDLPTASQWAAKLPAGDERNTALRNIAYGSAFTAPELAVSLASQLPENNERDDLLEHIAAQWSGSDFEAATTWLTQFPESPLRQRLLVAAALAIAKEDGSTAASFVARFLPPGDEQGRAAVAVAQRWSESSPEAAQSWIKSFPAGAVQESAQERLKEIETVQNTTANEPPNE